MKHFQTQRNWLRLSKSDNHAQQKAISRSQCHTVGLCNRCWCHSLFKLCPLKLKQNFRKPPKTVHKRCCCSRLSPFPHSLFNANQYSKSISLFSFLLSPWHVCRPVGPRRTPHQGESASPRSWWRWSTWRWSSHSRPWWTPPSGRSCRPVCASRGPRLKEKRKKLINYKNQGKMRMREDLKKHF